MKVRTDVTHDTKHWVGMVGFVIVNEALWLLHEHTLRQSTLEECIVYIQLTERPPTSDYQAEHNFDYSGLDNWTKGVMEISSWTLMKPLGN